MSGPPFRSGSSQVAVRVVDEPSTAASSGLSGLADFSSAFNRTMFTSMVSVPSLPSSAFTVIS